MVNCPDHRRVKGFRNIWGIRFYKKGEKSKGLKALCDECIKKIDSSAEVKNEGEAGVRSCDVCGVYNALYQR